MTEPTIWNQLLIWPILNLLIVFVKIFEAAKIPGAFGLAIIALTVVIRGALSPLAKAQLTSAKKMQDLKPRLDELSKRHKDDKVKLQQAQLELYKTEGINPAAGCLPTILQIPMFIALYNVFIQVLQNGGKGEFVSTINQVLYHPSLHIQNLDLHFFGLNLGVRPNQWQEFGIGLLLIPVITGLLQLVQTRLMTGARPKTPKTDKPQDEDQMMQMQQQMGYIMPVMIGFFALSFPVGLAIYWNTFTIFGIMQQLSINKNK